jgi:molybdenum cofactor cytidylyltransferase
MKLGAIVPAAGFSRRMGREKVLLPFGDSTVLETVLAKLAQLELERSVVVLRPDLPDAERLAADAGARVVVNPHPEEEMLVSIRLGLAALAGSVDAFFVWPVDHPGVAPATLSLLAAEARREKAVIPVHRGARGHPAVVGADLVPEISRIPPRAGLRQLWRSRADAVRELAVDDPGVVENLDDPDAWTRARERLRRTTGRDFGSEPE